MFDSPRRFTPRSAVSATDLVPLQAAVVELDSRVSDPAPTFGDLLHRLIGFQPAEPEAEVRGGIVNLGSIALPDRTT